VKHTKFQKKEVVPNKKLEKEKQHNQEETPLTGNYLKKH
jgi:hypothetical protein